MREKIFPKWVEKSFVFVKKNHISVYSPESTTRGEWGLGCKPLRKRLYKKNGFKEGAIQEPFQGGRNGQEVKQARKKKK